ncbi:Spindle- and centromere-associated protein [Toxocara canis]|uniref:Spindle-and centromere-associated protein n=1 Tax=Toxocara canis TaxID=6265 RepID=A0A0B2VMU9_TOXCA|nr:Spindle- and centromere-associated protein [Toxocara canis]
MVDTPATENDETKRIAQTMIMRANYETSGGDTALAFSDVVTSGTALYDVSDSIGSDMFYSSGSRSGSLAVGSLDRDLNSFKKRIDANTEEQREHTDMMVGLQHKIEEYRRRIAETERQITTQKAVEGISFTIKEANDTWVPELNTTFTDYEWASRLDEERRSDVVTSGTALYDVSDSIGSDMFYSSGSRSGSLAVGSLDRDLNSFKKRIDANTEEQREHTDMMVGLQHKIEEYRRRIAETERQITTQKAVEGISFTIKEANDTWVPELNTTFTDYEWASRLDEERRRNDELRMQIAQQQIDIQRLQKQFEAGMYDKEKMYQQREKNLAYYLNAEQRKMMDVMEELQRVRRQFADYKEQTERDLENQKNEVAKVTRNAASGTHRLSEHGDVGLSQDVIISEALQRFREQQAAPVGASVEDYNALMRKYEETVQRVIELESRGDGNSTKLITLEADLRRTKDKLAECLEVLRKLYDLASESDRNGDLKDGMRSLSPGNGFCNLFWLKIYRYEETVQRVIELESRGDGNSTKLITLEADLRRTKDKLAECLEVLRKLYDLASESDRNGDLKDGMRSLSPGGTRVIPSEVYRGMRNVIRARDNQLEHVQRKLKNSDSQIDELTTRLEGAEETRRRTEKQLAEAKREINTHQRAVDDAHRELRRMEDRLRIVESEKIVAENARRQFEEEIRRLKMLVDQTAAEGERRALEEAEAQKNIVEDEYKTLYVDCRTLLMVAVAGGRRFFVLS